jgi:hypothetical protein
MEHKIQQKHACRHSHTAEATEHRLNHKCYQEQQPHLIEIAIVKLYYLATSFQETTNKKYEARQTGEPHFEQFANPTASLVK